MPDVHSLRVAERFLKRGGVADANRSYEERQHDAQQLLKKLQDLLKKHAADQKKHPGDWGYPGDLGYVVEELQNIVRSFEDSGL